MKFRSGYMICASCAAFAAISAQAPAAPPPRHPLTIAEALAVRMVSYPQLSPDGEQVLYAVTSADLAANARVTATYIVSAAGGAPRSRAVRPP